MFQNDYDPSSTSSFSSVASSQQTSSAISVHLDRLTHGRSYALLVIYLIFASWFEILNQIQTQIILFLLAIIGYFLAQLTDLASDVRRGHRRGHCVSSADRTFDDEATYWLEDGEKKVNGFGGGDEKGTGGHQSNKKNEKRKKKDSKSNTNNTTTTTSAKGKGKTSNNGAVEEKVRDIRQNQSEIDDYDYDYDNDYTVLPTSKKLSDDSGSYCNSESMKQDAGGKRRFIMRLGGEKKTHLVTGDLNSSLTTEANTINDHDEQQQRLLSSSSSASTNRREFENQENEISDDQDEDEAIIMQDSELRGAIQMDPLIRRANSALNLLKALSLASGNSGSSSSSSQSGGSGSSEHGNEETNSNSTAPLASTPLSPLMLASTSGSPRIKISSSSSMRRNHNTDTNTTVQRKSQNQQSPSSVSTSSSASTGYNSDNQTTGNSTSHSTPKMMGNETKNLLIDQDEEMIELVSQPTAMHLVMEEFAAVRSRVQSPEVAQSLDPQEPHYSTPTNIPQVGTAATNSSTGDIRNKSSTISVLQRDAELP